MRDPQHGPSAAVALAWGVCTVGAQCPAGRVQGCWRLSGLTPCQQGTHQTGSQHQEVRGRPPGALILNSPSLPHPSLPEPLPPLTWATSVMSWLADLPPSGLPLQPTSLPTLAGCPRIPMEVRPTFQSCSSSSVLSPCHIYPRSRLSEPTLPNLITMFHWEPTSSSHEPPAPTAPPLPPLTKPSTPLTVASKQRTLPSVREQLMAEGLQCTRSSRDKASALPPKTPTCLCL